MAQPDPMSPEWFLARLHKQLADARPKLDLYDAYYEGDHKLAFATEKFREAFGLLFRAFADNWCDVVVDATAERLGVQGFRFGDSPEGDKGAWDIWQRNNLDAGSQMLTTDALVQSRAFTLVQPGDDDRPQITVESALQCAVECTPGTNARAAGLKEWLDDWTGYVFATVYLPDGIFKFQSTDKQQGDTVSSTIQWKPREGLPASEAWPLPNPLGVVPLVAFANRPRLTAAGRSEIKTVVPIQNAVNKLCADMMIAAEFQAFRQRVLMGAEIPVDPVTNQPIDGYKHAISRLWMVTDADPDHPARISEFGTVDLDNFVKAIEMYVSHIASQTRTPPHYFERPGGQFPSGESIKSAETGLVAKCRTKMVTFGEAWEETIRLALKLAKDPKADAFDAETIWRDPEYRSEAEHTDALIKLQALGVPQEQLWADAGYSPQQIERFKQMREDEAKLAALRVPPPQVFDPLIGQFTERKDINLKTEAPFGQPQEPRPVGANEPPGPV